MGNLSAKTEQEGGCARRACICWICWPESQLESAGQKGLVTQQRPPSPQLAQDQEGGCARRACICWICWPESQLESADQKGLVTQQRPPSPQLAQDIAKQIDALQSIMASRSRCQAIIAACKCRIGTHMDANSINAGQTSIAALQNHWSSIKNDSSAELEVVDALQANVVFSFCAEPMGATGNAYCTSVEEDALNSPALVQNTNEQSDNSVVGPNQDFQKNRGERNGILHKLPSGGKSMRKSIFMQGIFARCCMCITDLEDAQMKDNHQEQKDSAKMRAAVPQ